LQGRALESILHHFKVRGGPSPRNTGLGERAGVSNLELVKTLLSILRELGHPQATEKLISFVKDRPGHDSRYAIDGSKIELELGWRAQETIGTGLRQTVEWYLKNGDWVRSVQDDGQKAWMQANYQERPSQTA